MKVLGIIKSPGYGCRDFPGQVGLWFDVYISEHMAALQCFFGEEATKIIQDYGVYNVKDLEGKACWVDDDKGYIRWISACNIR